MANKKDVQEVIKGGLILQSGFLIGKLFRMVLQMVLTRGLGVTGYGLYALGMSFNDLVICFGSMGHFGAIVRFGSIYVDKNEKSRLKGLVVELFVITQAIVLGLAVLLFIFADKIAVLYFHNSELGGVLKIICIGLPFYAVFLEILAVTIAFQKLAYTTILNDLIQVISQILLVSLVLFLGLGLLGATATFVLATIISIIAGFLFLGKHFPQFFSNLKSVFEFKRVLTYSLPLTVILFSQIMFLNINKIIIGLFNTPYEVGIFNVVFLVSYQLPLLAGALVQSFAPVISILQHKQELNKLEQYYKIVARWNNFILFFPALIIIVFNQDILALFGPLFKNGGAALIILSIVFFIDSIPGNLSKFFEITGLQKIESINSVCTVILNMVLGFIFIPRWGLWGAVIAISVSMLFISAIRLVELKINFKFSPLTREYLFFLLYGVLAMGIAYLFLKSMNFYLKIAGTIILMSGSWPFIKRVKEKSEV